MSRPALPEERGHDERPDLLTLNELKRCHDWDVRSEDMYEPGDGLYEILVCRQCGHERPMSRRGRAPDCSVRELPSDAIEHARRCGLIPEAVGGREDSMAGVPGEAAR